MKTNSTQKIALITGITGQDGAYLAELLLSKGYEVHGIRRQVSLDNTNRIFNLIKDTANENRFFLHYGELTDSLGLTQLIQKIQPDEIYNLAAMSHVKISFDTPEYTANADGLGTLRILEAIKFLGLQKKTKFYQASTSELFGLAQSVPQNEKTPFYPRSPYGVAKLFAYWTTVNYREAYGIFACNGILFNHESPLRGENFVTRKITRAVSQIALGNQDFLEIGNLDAQRDWGHAKDYVKAMWLMLQQDHPEDFVIGTGITTKVRDFVHMAFAHIGFTIRWEGAGVEEVGILDSVDEEKFKKATGKSFEIKSSRLETLNTEHRTLNTERRAPNIGSILVRVDSNYFRPTEVDLLIADASKAKTQLGWKPEYDLSGLVDDMMRGDLGIEL